MFLFTKTGIKRVSSFLAIQSYNAKMQFTLAQCFVLEGVGSDGWLHFVSMKLAIHYIVCCFDIAKWVL